MNNNNYLKRETHEYTIFIRNFKSLFGTWIKEEKKDFHWLFLNFFKRSKAGYCWNKHNLMLIPPPFRLLSLTRYLNMRYNFIYIPINLS